MSRPVRRQNAAGSTPLEISRSKRLPPRRRRSGSLTGFTLIETLVVIAIMGVLSAMLLSYNHVSTTQLALASDQATVAGALNRAKALTLEKYTPGLTAGTTACAYGVHFASSSYIVYGVLGDASCIGVSDYSYGGVATTTVIQTLQLNAGVIFTVAPTDIYFTPPYLEAGSIPAGEAAVVLTDVKSGQTAKVTVSSGGAVSME